MVRKPYARIVYNGKDITEDISRYLIKVVITDKQLQKKDDEESTTPADSEKGESDELAIELENSTGLWNNDWMPQMRDRLTVEIGYEDEVYSFGTFEVDEIEFDGPPDKVSLRAIAAGISKKLRTKRSTAHEGKTLRQIAQTICEANGLTVQGEIEDIQIGRVTQDRESDLSFLERLARQYGYIFSVRDSVCVFTDIFGIHEAGPVHTIDLSEVSGYNIKFSTKDTKSAANVSYTDPVTMEEVSYQYTPTRDQLATWSTFDSSTPEDMLEIRKRVENKQQAERVAKSAIQNRNSRLITGDLSAPGNPRCMAGANFNLTGGGKLNGKYNIEQATHSIDRGGGYSMSLQIKKVGK